MHRYNPSQSAGQAAGPLPWRPGMQEQTCPATPCRGPWAGLLPGSQCARGYHQLCCWLVELKQQVDCKPKHLLWLEPTSRVRLGRAMFDAFLLVVPRAHRTTTVVPLSSNWTHRRWPLPGSSAPLLASSATATPPRPPCRWRPVHLREAGPVASGR